MIPILKKLEEKHNIPQDKLRMVIGTQFEMIREVSKKADSFNNFFPYIVLPYLFSFRIRKGKQNFLKKRALKRLENVHADEG